LKEELEKANKEKDEAWKKLNEARVQLDKVAGERKKLQMDYN